MRDLPKYSTCYQLTCMNNQWRPQIVVSDPRGHISGLGMPKSRHRLLWLAAYWLLTENSFTCSRRSFNHRKVHHVGSGNPNCVNVIGGGGRPPVIGSTAETKIRNGPLTPTRIGVCAHH